MYLYSRKSRSPEVRKSRLVIIEDLKKKNDTDDLIRHWLNRYGVIEGLSYIRASAVCDDVLT